MNEQTVRRSINKAEAAFLECWGALDDLKSVGPTQRVALFQGRLGEALKSLAALSEQIARERRRLNSRKSHVNHTWFVGRQRALGKYQNTLREAAGIGRALGDAFAWLFYQNSLDLLAQHLARPPIESFPTGVGGIGEIELVRGLQLVGGRFFVLHHSHTTILRIGDVSFIDLDEFNVAGLGEIKTHQVAPGELRIHLSTISDADSPLNLLVDEEVPAERLSPAEEMPDWVRERLQRQVDVMKSAIGSSTPPDYKGADLARRGLTGRLTELAESARVGRPAIAQVDPALVGVVMRFRRSGLYSRLTGTKHAEVGLDDLPTIASDILAEGSTHNSVHIGSLLFRKDGSPQFQLGSIPLLWSDMPMETLRRFYFQEWFPVVVFNPAPILDRLERAGFAINPTGSHPFDIEAERMVGDRRCVLHGFPYYFHLVMTCVMSSEDVSDIIDALVVESEGRVTGEGPYRLQLNLNIRPGRPPTGTTGRRDA